LAASKWLLRLSIDAKPFSTTCQQIDTISCENSVTFIKAFALAAILVICVGVSIQPISNNLADLGYLGAAFQPSPVAINPLPTETCRQTWLRAVINFHLNPVLSEADFTTILHCGSQNVSLLQSLEPVNINHSVQAATAYPNNATAWFWVGDATAPTDPTFARQAYLQTVTLNPRFSLAWCRLGWSYEHTEEIESALNAFLNCCQINDPGSNGCYGAGRMAEKLGDPQKAIEYYRMSHWEGSLKRADELEAELNSGK